MNILHISAQKPDSTGSGVYLTEVVRALDRAGHNQAVVCGVAPEDAIDLPGGVLVRPVVFDTPELPFHVVGMSDNMPYPATRYRDLTPEMTAQFKTAFNRAFDDVLAQFKPDLVFCHHLYLVCAIMAHRAWPCPTTAISHSTDLRQFNKIPLERGYIREGVQRLDGIFALHEAQAEQIAETYGVPRDRIRVIGTGYNAAVFNAGVRAKDGQEAGEGIATSASSAHIDLVYAGKIWEKKGVRSLIRAVERMDERDRMAVRLAGGYSSREEYDSIVAQARATGLDFRFLGKLPQAELAQVYGASDVFVLPSFFEGLPLVVVEALACGCKVVVTDLPGIRPWIEQSLPGAPVRYVEPPRMVDTDTPLPEDLPAFEAHLAEALHRAIAAPAHACDTTALSWDNVAQRILGTH